MKLTMGNSATESVVMEREMVGDEGRDKVVAVIVTFMQSQCKRVVDLLQARLNVRILDGNSANRFQGGGASEDEHL